MSPQGFNHEEHQVRVRAAVGRTTPVLDDGFIELTDVMGSDAAIVQAARVSYGEGTKTYREDRALIRYLMRNRHTSPFEMAELKFHVRVPMDTWRQWVRHRTASINEYSTRYSEAVDSAQQTHPGHWRRQSAQNRQGSEGFLPEDAGRMLTLDEADLQARAREVYQARLRAGVAREQARKDLPLSTYTEAYWKIDLHNLLRFLELRLDPHAQLEIREYAKAIAHNYVVHLFPLTWEAFLDYRLGAFTLSRHARKLLAARLQGNAAAEQEILASGALSAREIRELEEALAVQLSGTER